MLVLRTSRCRPLHSAWMFVLCPYPAPSSSSCWWILPACACHLDYWPCWTLIPGFWTNFLRKGGEGRGRRWFIIYMFLYLRDYTRNWCRWWNFALEWAFGEDRTWNHRSKVLYILYVRKIEVICSYWRNLKMPANFLLLLQPLRSLFFF